MAQEQTVAPVATPTAAARRAGNTENNDTVLEGLDVFSLSIGDNPLDYRSDSKLAGQQYHVGRYRGVGFTCSPEFYESWTKGDIARMTLTKEQYERVSDDPENPGTQITTTTESYRLSGWMTNSQVQAFYNNQLGIVDAKTKVKIIERKAEVALGLDDKTLAGLLDKI